MGPFYVIGKVGWVGVDLFFVLSGFLISGLLFKEWDRCGTLNLRRFWLRRGFKIWPAYFAAFGAAMLLRSAQLWHQQGAGAALDHWRRYWPNVLLVQNYFPESRHWYYTWSVAVEEHFYLALPLVLLALAAVARRGRRGAGTSPFPHLPLAGLFVLVACLAMRLAVVARGAEWTDLHFATHLRADSLFFGVLLGYAHQYHRDRFVRACRQYSYTIYLAHGAMQMTPGYGHALLWADDVGGLWARRVVFVAGALAGGVLLGWVVERPALRLRDRLIPARG
jgi:peptidoglycan/LPS O-acetylase OafA/YrhL